MRDGGHGNDGSAPNNGKSSAVPEHMPSLSVDEALGLLSDWHRREALYYMNDSDNDIADLSSIVDHLKERELDEFGRRPDHDELELSFLHVHLPKLADADIIEYDERSCDIRFSPHPILEEALERTRTYDR